MADLPSLTAVIPSRHRLERLPALVSNYLAQGVDQVVVVLDGPHPGWSSVLGELTRQAQLLVLELDPHRGLPLARKAGLDQATGDVILIADDDVVPCPGLVDAHRTFHSTHLRSALLGYMPVDLPVRRKRDQAATFLYAKDYQNQVDVWNYSDDAIVLLQSFWGGNVSVPRSLYQEAEGYMSSIALPYNEDLDLGMRLARVGASASFQSQARAVHQHRRDLGSFRRECEVRGRAVFLLRQRWGVLPEQLESLIQIPESHTWFVKRIQAMIGARDRAGFLEWLLVTFYHTSGILGFWRIQDGLTRLLRRGLAIRGHRLSCEEPSERATHQVPN